MALVVGEEQARVETWEPVPTFGQASLHEITFAFLCLQPLPEPDGLSSPCFGRHFAQVLPRLAHLTTVSFSRCDIADADLIRSVVLPNPACIWRAIGRSQRVHARQDLQ